MTSDFSNTVSSVNVDGDSVRLSRTSTNHHCNEIDRQQRQNLHTKRAATIDAETHKEKLRIVVLGATKVG